MKIKFITSIYSDLHGSDLGGRPTRGGHYKYTRMSHIYQLTKKGEIISGLLQLTPTEHNKFEHYDRNLRKES